MGPSKFPVLSGSFRPRGQDDSYSRRPRDRSRDPSASSPYRQRATNAKRRGRERSHSAPGNRPRRRSRSPSLSPERLLDQGQTVHKVVSFADRLKPFEPGAVAEGVRDEREEDDRLQIDKPGNWVLKHHRNNLVVELTPPKISFIESTLSPVLKKIREIKEGRKRPDVAPRTSSGDAMTTTTTTATNTTPTYAPSGDGRRFRISFAEVQRMRIRKLQCELVRHVVNMRREGHESAGWEEALKEYSMSVKLFVFGIE